MRSERSTHHKLIIYDGTESSASRGCTCLTNQNTASVRGGALRDRVKLCALIFPSHSYGSSPGEYHSKCQAMYRDWYGHAPGAGMKFGNQTSDLWSGGVEVARKTKCGEDVIPMVES